MITECYGFNALTLLDGEVTSGCTENHHFCKGTRGVSIQLVFTNISSVSRLGGGNSTSQDYMISKMVMDGICSSGFSLVCNH